EIEENSISKYDMLEDSINTAIEDCETIPFFSDKKIVIINNPFFLTGETPKTPLIIFSTGFSIKNFSVPTIKCINSIISTS
ncbi:MAG TPA: hypothetical protein GX690_02250, partial [Tenericutes bacterium]|nr:hypothetical protein [Mycoplasmatota bacterium]